MNRNPAYPALMHINAKANIWSKFMGEIYFPAYLASEHKRRVKAKFIYRPTLYKSRPARK